ncbi:MAG: hypothetical protein O7A98_04095, partial [Acidobacteria bacterium]|nr:hypothetical protein [Acidobacteriota bacterium]
NRERVELRQELTSSEPDRQRVEELVSSTGDRAEALDRAFAENVLFVREMLDGAPEQRYIRFLAEMYSRERSGWPPGSQRRDRQR